MDGYVEKLGDIGKDDLDGRDLKDTVLKELGVHTENISQLTEQRKVRWDAIRIMVYKGHLIRATFEAVCFWVKN